MEATELQNELHPSAEVRAAVAQMWEHVRAITDVLASVSRERDALVSRLQAVEESKEADTAADHDIEELRNKLIVAEERYATANRLLSSFQNRKGTEENFESLNASLESLSTDNDALLQRLQAADTAASNAESAVASKSAIDAAELDSYKRRVEEQDNTIAELEEQLQSAEAKINELASGHSSTDASVDAEDASTVRAQALTIENLERQLRVLRMQSNVLPERKEEPANTNHESLGDSNVDIQEIRADIESALSIVNELLAEQQSAEEEERNSQ